MSTCACLCADMLYFLASLHSQPHLHIHIHCELDACHALHALSLRASMCADIRASVHPCVRASVRQCAHALACPHVC
eukprot:15443598-Alexandrium_andersonii.AAC.1